jgi:hypothetical protein
MNPMTVVKLCVSRAGQRQTLRRFSRRESPLTRGTSSPGGRSSSQRPPCSPVAGQTRVALWGGVALADRDLEQTGTDDPVHGFVGVCRFRFPRGVITVAVRWYLRYGLSYRR